MTHELLSIAGFTPRYHLIYDLVEKHGRNLGVTARQLTPCTGLALSYVQDMLQELERGGFLVKIAHGTYKIK